MIWRVWQGHRFRRGAEWLARVLGYDRGPLIDGRPTRVGQLFLLRTPGASERRYLLRREGLVELGPLAYAVAAGDPGTSRAYPGASVVPTELTPGALSRTPVVPQPASPAGRPHQSAGAAVFLVTDAGVRSPVAAQAMRRLGSRLEQAWPVLCRLLGMLPIGPVVDASSGVWLRGWRGYGP